MKNEIFRIIQIESNFIAQYDELKAQYGINEFELDMTSTNHAEYISGFNQIHKLLSNYLNNLSDNNLSQLTALMYIGRGDYTVNIKDDFNQWHDYLRKQGFSDRNKCIGKISEKQMSLNEYYSNALKSAGSLNFDVDSDFN